MVILYAPYDRIEIQYHLIIIYSFIIIKYNNTNNCLDEYKRYLVESKHICMIAYIIILFQNEHHMTSIQNLSSGPALSQLDQLLASNWAPH